MPSSSTVTTIGPRVTRLVSTGTARGQKPMTMSSTSTAAPASGRRRRQEEAAGEFAAAGGWGTSLMVGGRDQSSALSALTRLMSASLRAANSADNAEAMATTRTANA